MKGNIKYQLIKLTIPAAGATVSIDFETDKQYQRVTGLLYTSSNANAIQGSVFSKLEINQKEIFPNDYEVKLIQTGQEVMPDDRYYALDEPAAGSRVDGKYIDGGNGGAGYPYLAIIYLRLENRVDDAKRM